MWETASPLARLVAGSRRARKLGGRFLPGLRIPMKAIAIPGTRRSAFRGKTDHFASREFSLLRCLFFLVFFSLPRPCCRGLTYIADHRNGGRQGPES